ncbi:MAG: hypothetical protein V4721_16605 [Bacteroidota bacterium]
MKHHIEARHPEVISEREAKRRRLDRSQGIPFDFPADTYFDRYMLWTICDYVPFNCCNSKMFRFMQQLNNMESIDEHRVASRLIELEAKAVENVSVFCMS